MRTELVRSTLYKHHPLPILPTPSLRLFSLFYKPIIHSLSVRDLVSPNAGHPRPSQISMIHVTAVNGIAIRALQMSPRLHRGCGARH
jgi:hypothetical protein